MMSSRPRRFKRSLATALTALALAISPGLFAREASGAEEASKTSGAVSAPGEAGEASKAGGDAEKKKAAPKKARAKKKKDAVAKGEARAASKKKAKARKTGADKALAEKSHAEKTHAEKSSNDKASAEKAPAEKASVEKAPADKTHAAKASGESAPDKASELSKTAAAGERDASAPAKAGSNSDAPAAPKSEKHAGSKKKKTAERAREGDSDKTAKAVADGKADRKSAKANAKKKRTASRSNSSKRRSEKKSSDDKEAPPPEARAKTPPKPCFGPAVPIDRSGLEAERLSLVTCDGKPIEAARDRLSVLARPWGAARPELGHADDKKPSAKAKTNPNSKNDAKGARAADPIEVAPGIRRVDPGLLSRIDAIARKFPDKPISVVSGYRPQSRGSLHQTARAIDLRVAGVSNDELVAFCKTLRDTGCGFYPNSSFVHVDVRLPGTGGVSWIDASGPGEPPRYVTQWPPPPEPETAPPFVPPAATGGVPPAATGGVPPAATGGRIDDEREAGEPSEVVRPPDGVPSSPAEKAPVPSARRTSPTEAAPLSSTAVSTPAEAASAPAFVLASASLPTAPAPSITPCAEAATPGARGGKRAGRSMFEDPPY